VTQSQTKSHHQHNLSFKNTIYYPCSLPLNPVPNPLDLLGLLFVAKSLSFSFDDEVEEEMNE